MAFAAAGICGSCFAAEPESRDEKIATVVQLACQADVPPGFALAVLDKESSFNNAVRGRRGEVGISQILPSTARRMGLDLQRLTSEFAYNAQAGIRLMKTAIGQARGDQTVALLNYRTGPNWRRLPARTQLAARRHAVEVVAYMHRRYGQIVCPVESDMLSADALE